MLVDELPLKVYVRSRCEVGSTNIQFEAVSGENKTTEVGWVGLGGTMHNFLTIFLK